MFSWTKFRPGRVTRTEAAFGIVLAFGKPPGRGVVPQVEQPLEQPPPLHDATRRSRAARRMRRARLLRVLPGKNMAVAVLAA
jgi:hypothetical protein